ncbi:MAG: galactokinase [Cyclobacteriaceae bacterium]|nr:galactokinase [Cyclobacteriaceae bacterium]
MEYLTIAQKFREKFSSHPRIYRAPGRINLIGEHTDYNDGFVLPAAIDKNVIFAVAPNSSGLYRFYACDPDQDYEAGVNSIQYTRLKWPNYLLGVIDQLKKRGHIIEGFDCVFGSDIPIGAGLSSSAALESGLAVALNDLYDLREPRIELVKLSQKAENEFVGVNCGIMDQFASIFGRKDFVFRLDCRSLEHTYFPLELQNRGILLIDTRVKHELATSAYNTRRKECEAGVYEITQYYPEIKNLRDVSPDLMYEFSGKMDPVIYRRCKYVVEENDRVLQACEDLENHRIEEFGTKMYETHQGLRYDYEVSCPELDFLVNLTLQKEEVLGARMMGGGFGGCTINIVELEAMHELKLEVMGAFAEKFGIEPFFYPVAVKDGVTEIL